MTTYTRLARFSVVGALGIAVQLAALRMLSGSGIHYLAATALAVESAVLHNFFWHQRFTWLDRPGNAETIKRLIRFHLSNGAVSFFGNLLIMRGLVGVLQIPLVPANLLSIGACALINFLLGDRWVFAGTGQT
ncbi:MAG TPA: GtrA family protein [Terriglobales bacterium]|nr:GtrA family protein [Terriglobales bacterium]